VATRTADKPLPIIRPMLLESGALPEDDARHLYEVKYDGWRAMVYADRGALRIVTRRGNEISPRLPELAPMAERIKRRRAILDAEIVVIGADGKPDFAGMSEKMAGEGQGTVCLMLFDLLHLDGDDLTRRPLEERKRALSDLDLNGAAWRTVSYSVGNGAALLAAARDQRLEGLIAKRLGSKYTPGRRTRDWIKIKNFESREMSSPALRSSAARCQKALATPSRASSAKFAISLAATRSVTRHFATCALRTDRVQVCRTCG